jgi:ankyrin repeat protein
VSPVTGGSVGGGGSGAADLFAAIKAGDEAAAARALDADPSLLGARTESGESPLILSAYYRQGRIAQMLLARGAPVDLFEACAVGEAARVEGILAREPGRVDAHAPDGFTPLTLACFFGHEEVVRALLARGANVDLAATHAMAVAPLHAAVAGRHETIACLLLAAGANPNAASHGGWRPAAQAAAHGDLGILKDLLDHGADPNPRNDEGRSALALALEKGQAEAAELLRARGAR